MSSGAIGILETRGMASLLGASDAMLKAAEVRICGRHGIGSGWLTVVIEGQVAAVKAAIAVGEAEANRAGELIRSQIVPRPETLATAAMPHGAGLGVEVVGAQALGLLETQGLTPLVVGADAMVKAADVEIERLNIGSGGRITALATGRLDDVQMAVAAGVEGAVALGEVDASAVVSRPDPELMACFAGSVERSRAPMPRRAMGLIETRSTVALVRAVDRMLKTANIEYEGSYKVGYYLTATIVRGDVGAVRVAIDAGREEAVKHGELVSAYVIPQPYGGVEGCLPHT